MSDLNLQKERQQESIHIEAQKNLQQTKRDAGAPPSPVMARQDQKSRDVLKNADEETLELTQENIGNVHFTAQVDSSKDVDPIIEKTQSKSINMVSGTGSQNINRIKNGIEPKVNTKYLD